MSALSDLEGHFQVDVSPGRYAVAVDKIGFFQSVQRPLINVQPQERSEALKVSLTRASVIEGRILNSSREPIASATVTALRVWIDNGRRILRPPGSSSSWSPGAVSPGNVSGFQMTTDDGGRFRLFGLESGDYFLQVWLRQGGTVATYFYPGIASLDQAVPIRLIPGNDALLGDVIVRRSPRYSVTFSVPLACKSTAFHLVQGRGEGLEITLLNSLSADQPSADLMPSARVTGLGFTRAGSNRWIGTNLAPGSYDVYHTSCSSSDRDSTSIGHLHFRIVDRDVDAGSMEMRDARPLVGRITATPAAAQFVQQLSNRAMAFYDFDHSSPLLLPVTSAFFSEVFGDRVLVRPPYQLAQDGAFRIPMFPGLYGVNVVPLPEQVFIASVKSGGREVRDSGIDFKDQPSAAVEILIDSPPGQLEGIVQDSRKEALGGVHVVLIPELSKRRNARLFRNVSADSFGRYSIRNIVPGTYKLFAWKNLPPGAYTDPAFLSPFEQSGIEVQIERGSRNNVTVSAR
jgi:hypothetical protein